MTEPLKPEQLTTLGHNFLAFAQAVGNYRYAKKLSPEIDKKLSDIHWTLLNYSDDFYTASACILLVDTRKSLLSIKQIIKEMNENYLRIRNVQKAIDVAAALATLGAALFSKSPQAIDAAIGKLVKEIGD